MLDVMMGHLQDLGHRFKGESENTRKCTCLILERVRTGV